MVLQGRLPPGILCDCATNKQLVEHMTLTAALCFVTALLQHDHGNTGGCSVRRPEPHPMKPPKTTNT